MSSRVLTAPDQVEAGLDASDGDTMLLVGGEQRRNWAKVATGAAGAMLLLGGAGFGAAHYAGRGLKAAGREMQLLQQIVAKPGPDQCSDYMDDCSSTACCKQAGYTCFETVPGKASCMKYCIPSPEKSCLMPQNLMEPILVDASPVATSLYCFSTYMADIGVEERKVFELENLQLQYSRNIGIFNCEWWQVFADAYAELAPGVPFVKVDDVDGDFHFAKRLETNTWVNTGLHTQAWKAVAAAGVYKSAGWVVKVDADAVFLPSRLKPMLEDQLVPANGIYLENCQFVNYGYFGNLEVFSLAAFDALAWNVDNCKASLPWKVGVEGGKYGPMGEDLFAQQCLASLGVRRVEAFDISTDAACEADRPEGEKKNKKWRPDCASVSTPQIHPFYTPDAFSKCYDDTVAAFGL